MMMWRRLIRLSGLWSIPVGVEAWFHGSVRGVLTLLVLGWLVVPDAALGQSALYGGKPSKFGGRENVKGTAKMMERFRTKLAVTNDQEWVIIQQRLERVLRAQREVQQGVYAKRSTGNTRSGGDPGADGARLRRLVENQAAPKEIRAAVAAVRELLRQKQAELETAEEDLRSVLTPRQEAIALLSGWLR